MNTTHLPEQDICLYVDAMKLQKTGELPEDLVDHVSGCTECKKQIMQLYDALGNEDYRDAGRHPLFGPHKQARSTGMLLVYRVAAALVLLLGLGFAAYYAFVKRPANTPSPSHAAVVDSSVSAQEQESRTISPPREDYAANFTPSPTMEDLVGAELRSAAVTVLSPTNGQAVKGDIIFRWSSDEEAQFRVRIVTNEEEEVFQSATDRHMVLCDKRLTPGLYYWTLQANGGLVHVGKFFVGLTQEVKNP